MTSTYWWRRGCLAAAAAVTLTAGIAPPAGAEPPSAKTSQREAQRVDAIPAPKLDWQPCSDAADTQCATVQLPLDYDEPGGEQITIALRKVPAANQAERIGSLFINPGGPGTSAKESLANGGTYFSESVRDRFDLIGMDPRGMGDSSPLKCITNPDEVLKVATPAFLMGFPLNSDDARTYQKSYKAIADACSGSKLASAMTTTEVARDMDVLRRALGDDKLNYLGFSYGSYLGQVYANMFPDRVRAVAIDGIINPPDWLGSRLSAFVPLNLRLDSALASEKAFEAVLSRCAQVGDCPLADPVADASDVLAKLRERPVTFPLPDGGTQTVTFQDVVSDLLKLLYDEDTVEAVPEYLAIIKQLQAAPEGAPSATTRLSELRTQAGGDQSPFGLAPTIHDLESVTRRAAVICSEGAHPSARAARSIARVYDFDLPHFGAKWIWEDAICAAPNWQVRDEDAYRGPFNQKTAAPVLVVGNEHDPATYVENAREVAKILPNSRLVVSDNWGHTAYGKSMCATDAIDNYLLDPEGGQRIDCRDGRQPFS